ncbi:MAG: lipopolysaccharide biosynthesis protein [Candidatus Omnitrophica bacterium]|nr:lipopolysaccharide biosynthesis protein [Candidatus Omnitrophota bacterium]MCG2705611.1 lipopolysaccharide biosynthesis protein [Candidatus Omnitrophota bacterium]
MKSFLRSERLHRLSKEGLWVVFGQATAVIGSLIGVRILTGLLDPTAYGELVLGMTVATLINQAVFGPLGNGVTRFYAPAVEKRDFDGYLNAVLRLVLSATGVVILILLLMAAGLLIAGRTEWIAITTVALIFAILSGYNSILSGVQNAARQRSIVALHQGIDPWVRFLVAAGLMIFLGATSTMAMVGYAMAAMLLLCSQYVFFRKVVPKYISVADKERNWSAEIWKYSWPFATWGIFTWIQLSSDRWALNFFSTTQNVGLYGVLFQLGYYPISMAAGMAMQFLTPIFYQQAGSANDNRRNTNVNSLSWRLTGFTLGATFITFLAAFLFHAQIFRIFAAKEYASISYLLPWMFLAGGVFAAGQAITLNLQSQMKTRVIMTAKIITALLGVIFNFAGAYWYGITGIVIAGVFFSAVYFIWMAALSKYN